MPTHTHTHTQEYQQVVDAEWKILYDKLDKIVQSGAKVVLSKLPIGDVATQYFADRSVSCWLCTHRHGYYYSCGNNLIVKFCTMQSYVAIPAYIPN